jgi:gas vesicle structural protein
LRIERTAGTANVIDILDRVLDKGIVIDAWVRVSAAGIEIVTVEARIVVASIATYLDYSGVLAELKQPAAPNPT